MSIFSDKEIVVEGGCAGGGKAQKVRERVRDAAPRHVYLFEGRWDVEYRLFSLASGSSIDVKYIREDLAAQDLLYKLARHIRNTDETPVTLWGVQGLDLLAQLREVDPERYDKEVKQ